MSSKAEFVNLVAALRGCRLRFREIGLALNRTPERIGQVVTAYDLDPPKLKTRDAVMAWLAAHHPALAVGIDGYLKKQNDSPTRSKPKP